MKKSCDPLCYSFTFHANTLELSVSYSGEGDFTGFNTESGTIHVNCHGNSYQQCFSRALIEATEIRSNHLHRFF